MIRKKKIAFIVNSISDNGVTKVLSILLDEIDYKEFDVHVVLTRHKPRKRKLNSNAIIVEAQDSDSTGLTSKIKEIFAIRRIIKRERYREVIALGNYAAMYTLLGTLGLKVRKVISERNDPNSEPSKKIYRKLRDLIYRKADIIVCQTKDASNYYEGIVSKQIVIANPISDNLPLYTGKRDRRIVNFCRIDKQKNLTLLINAFQEFLKSYPEYRLEIYGDGPLKREIEEYIDAVGLNDKVFLLDFCLDIHERIKSAAMFVSSSDFEGMSNSMLESLAIGIPTICTDCPIGGAREVIQSGKNGILVPVGDKSSMVKAMKKIVEHTSETEKMVMEAIKIRERLSKNKICELWWSVINT